MIRPFGVLLLLVLASAVPAEDHPTPRPAVGDRGVALTAVTGSRVEEIPLTFLGTANDFIGPGYDLHLVRLEGPVADRVGVAAGMSGSPVYFDGKLLGALAYRMGALPDEPVAGVTPIENMLDAARGAAPGGLPSGGTSVSPIATPVLVGSMVGAVREWIAPELARMGFVMVGGGAGDDVRGSAEALRPGSPVGVELVRGDMSIAATGTVTLVDGSRVYAFGHPFLGAGQVEMPMVSAEVIHTLADMAGSVKLANTGGEIGAIVEDRLTAIVGRLGARARMTPVELVVRGGAYGEQTLRFEIARVSPLAPLLAGAVVANGLLGNTGSEQRATMLVSGRIELEGQPDLPLELAFAGDPATGSNPALSIARSVQQLLSGLWTNRFATVDLRRIALNVDVRPEIVSYRLEALNYDREPVHPGQTVDLRCVLRKHRGGTEIRELSIVIPEGISAGTPLALAVGSPARVDRALGQPIQRRLNSADDLSGLVRALSERRSAHRLTAVLYRSAAGVVAHGSAYERLPPTAERLLSARARSGTTSSTRVATLADSELELDGPIDGGIVVRLNLEPSLEAEESRR